MKQGREGMWGLCICERTQSHPLPPPQPSTADWGEDAELEGTEDPGRQIFSSLGRGDNQGIGKDRGGGQRNDKKGPFALYIFLYT